MSPKHNIDPVNQGSFLPPSEALQKVVGQVVESEGVYYPGMKNAEPEVLTPEQIRLNRLRSEDAALEFIGKASETAVRIGNMERGLERLRREDRDHAEQNRLAVTISNSELTRLAFRRVAKRQYASSIGIETKEITTTKDSESQGYKVKVIKVVAAQEEDEERLHQGYRSFGLKYETNRAAREERRMEIAEEVAVIMSTEEAALQTRSGPEAK